jgi:hypothetical protein
MQVACLAFSLALDRTGKSIAARMAIIATTTKSSISVKPCRAEEDRGRGTTENLLLVK